MDDEQKPDPSLLKLALYNHRVASLKRISENLTFKEWMNNSKTPRANPPVLPSIKVQPFLRLPTSSPAPQTQAGGLLMIKDVDRLLHTPAVQQEPWEGPTQLASTNKFQTPSNEMKLMQPNSSGNPNLQRKSPSLRPSSRPNPNPTIQNNQDQGLKFLPKTGIPTRPRSFLKRKAIDNKQPQKKLHPSNGIMIKKSAENLLCYLCKVSCSSALTMKQHIVGRSHKAKMKYVKMKRDGSTTTATGGRGGMPRCDLCEIWCSDVASLHMHFKGQKHKSKVRESQLCEERGGEKPSKAPIICEVCCVPCMNQELFEMHLKGRKHATKEGIKRIGF